MINKSGRSLLSFCHCGNSSGVAISIAVALRSWTDSGRMHQGIGTVALVRPVLREPPAIWRHACRASKGPAKTYGRQATPRSEGDQRNVAVRAAAQNILGTTLLPCGKTTTHGSRVHPHGSIGRSNIGCRGKHDMFSEHIARFARVHKTRQKGVGETSQRYVIYPDAWLIVEVIGAECVDLFTDCIQHLPRQIEHYCVEWAAVIFVGTAFQIVERGHSGRQSRCWYWAIFQPQLPFQAFASVHCHEKRILTRERYRRSVFCRVAPDFRNCDPSPWRSLGNECTRVADAKTIAQRLSVRAVTARRVLPPSTRSQGGHSRLVPCVNA